ncbi:uncharacterized protein BJX67DRAFT_245818 [Aspergillus lucknowensis]|uniref:Uncharacterized protein n=1 Tax=Aspergillus lucknowensis TaxID=176173 RepID=A0ABR4M1P5_9EURO
MMQLGHSPGRFLCVGECSSCFPRAFSCGEGPPGSRSRTWSLSVLARAEFDGRKTRHDDQGAERVPSRLIRGFDQHQHWGFPACGGLDGWIEFLDPMMHTSCCLARDTSSCRYSEGVFTPLPSTPCKKDPKPEDPCWRYLETEGEECQAPRVPANIGWLSSKLLQDSACTATMQHRCRNLMGLEVINVSNNAEP